ncbi:glycosyltransferase family 2 protein [Vibrio vulnificus]|uniref:glycosyltransferase family 2 protein n=1 Tax=Vibrio vulnificus TaxID=672 RepID=UPI00102885D7|nr:glycosyltransferase family 2 protein [Vibrio vulnificus]EGQ7993263.1 glycosyltransferase family 2 protein [Vibrio vulnificus]EGQ9975057.1 glycosyltransferase family 2 protein [Vibrio vulnificus]EHK9044002.1 glycosyltransferase family 2 protein [Vibrio vulnificus]ELU2537061.1 glycosyltransferase family 2 protein [Vibrio vulnificus]RZP72714.1 glycosyltransferase family 2 protein [Vibrio vulnificus]
MKLIFITVNYNNVKETDEFISCFLNGNTSDNILYVVDNSENKNPCKELELSIRNDNVVFLYPFENLGYMGGASFALDYHYNKCGFDFKYTLICNNDISFDAENIINHLSEHGRHNGDRFMLISPSVYDNGDNINPYMISRKSKCYMMMWNVILSTYTTFSIFHKINKFLSSFSKNKKVRKYSEKYVYGTHGSVFILSSDYFMSGGSIRKLPFLYGEEMYIAEQISRLNGKCIYVPEIFFNHKGSATLGKEQSKFKYQKIKEAHKYICKEFYC